MLFMNNLAKMWVQLKKEMFKQKEMKRIYRLLVLSELVHHQRFVYSQCGLSQIGTAANTTDFVELTQINSSLTGQTHRPLQHVYV